MENNNKQRALKLHLKKTLDVNYTVKQSEYDDNLFNVNVEFTKDKKEYLVLTSDETEDRLDENLDSYIEERLDEICAEVGFFNDANVRFLIDHFNYEMWKRTAKIDETAAINFNAVGGEEYYETVKDDTGKHISYNIYEIEI